MAYTFGEKTTEKIQSGGEWIDAPVWQTPKYQQSKAKAIELIEKKEYGLVEGDFWILMNKTKANKMNYTGLIISHNACLKINDKLENKFKAESVQIDKQGYNNSLVFIYSNAEQGMYEVGEVSTANCKNDYPYAMGFKRLFDRVVLKLSKIAFDGIYSEAESDEFKKPDEEVKEVKKPTAKESKRTQEFNALVNLARQATDGTQEKIAQYIKENYKVDSLKSCSDAVISELYKNKIG